MNCINRSHPKWKEFYSKYKNEQEANIAFLQWSNQESKNSQIKSGVAELFESNFLIFVESKTSDEVISKLLSNKLIDKKCN